MKKKCRVCGKEFYSSAERQRYCSEECYRINLCKRQKELRQESKRKRKRNNIQSIEEINRRALELGMTYGDYVSKFGL